jgi:hypothetical protein
MFLAAAFAHQLNRVFVITPAGKQANTFSICHVFRHDDYTELSWTGHLHGG